uniref:Large ribosomal subunit protein mL43 n=1 Tax=Mucochytrium quahogii TaxID=96639 RepID=A0A7S2RB73_9STRA|mmetsp:Transcript_13742/g.22425  ORF Transcript_13742/g.22425 Transcript_13742/m.22425 type:complete len:129 (+) Transcript_13742:49-435(+)
MCSRGVWQLEKLTIRYCQNGGSSKGIRKFIRHDVIKFAEENPQVSVQTVLKPNRHPIIVAEYKKGPSQVHSCRNYDRDEINGIVNDVRDRTGRLITRIKKPVYSNTPSIQGEWDTDVTKGTDFEVHFL